MKRVTQICDVPREPHHAVFEDRSIHIPGDERSRQYPGHGYPASTEEFVAYLAFNSKDEWEKHITERLQRDPSAKFLAVQIIPATIQTKVVVEVSAPQRAYTLLCPKCGKLAQTVARDGKSTRECENGHRWLPDEDKQ